MTESDLVIDKNQVRYIWKKFYQAVSAMASCSGTIQERLFFAYDYLHRLDLFKMPSKELDKKFGELKNTFKSIEIEGMTFVNIDDLECGKVAKKIVGIYDTICREEWHKYFPPRKR